MQPSVPGLHDVRGWGWLTLVQVADAVQEIARAAINGRVVSPIGSERPDSGKPSCRSMPYTCSHTTPYVMLPTRYRVSVLERCNDRICQTAIINLSSMLVLGWTTRTTLVSGVSTIHPVSGTYLTVLQASW